MKITEIKASSKRTEHIKVGNTVDSFVSFEAEYTATLDKDDDVEKATCKLYDIANTNVDKQVEEFINLCYGKDNESLETDEQSKKEDNESHS